MINNLSKPMRPEDMAADIIERPNLWGMYTITDEVYRMIRAAYDAGKHSAYNGFPNSHDYINHISNPST